MLLKVRINGLGRQALSYSQGQTICVQHNSSLS